MTIPTPLAVPTLVTGPTPLAIPTHLSDGDLVESLKRCVRDERHATASLVAHLAEMDARLIHLREGYASLFVYCCEALGLSESATYKRIDVARAVRRFPAVLERLSQGGLNLTTARLLAPHLTAENHEELLAAASGLGKRAVEEMVAVRFPKPDVPPLIRKAPTPQASLPLADPAEAGGPVASVGPVDPQADPVPPHASTAAAAPRAVTRVSRPLCVPLAADRYHIRFTASASMWRKLCMARDLLRHAVPSGDPSEIFERALNALIADLARKRCAQVKSPRRRTRPVAADSRTVPAEVRRAVWIRDQGRCAFVSPRGRRCGDHGFLELHHVKPYALGGPPTIANIELRCRAHNQYEAQVAFDRGPQESTEGREMRRAVADAGPDAGRYPSDSTGPGASPLEDARGGTPPA